MLSGTPLDLTPFGSIFRGIGVFYWIFVFSVIGIILYAIEGWWMKLVCVALALASLVLPVAYFFYLKYQEAQTWKAHMDKVQARFQMRCQSSGEKIYRKVDDVEGILLKNVRPMESGHDVEDPNWPGAALAYESWGDEFVASFLEWEHQENPRGSRGELTRDPNPYNRHTKDFVHPGYQFVDVVEDDFQISRDKFHSNLRDLVKQSAKESSARYSVELINLVDPEDRKLWIAGVKIVVRDESKNEVLGEKVRYVYEPGQGSLAHARQPWRFGIVCADDERFVYSSVRFFVDQVLKPRTE